MNYLKLYGRFFIVYIKSKTEYGFNFYMDFLALMFGGIMNYFMIWVIIERFHAIQGWGFYEVLFLFTINMFTFSISGLFLLQPMWEVQEMIRNGTFDGILVMPMNPFLHIICKKNTHGLLGLVVVSSVAFYICFAHLAITWSLMKVFWLIIVLIGAILIQSAVMIATASLSFWFVKSYALMDTTMFSIRAFLDYPIIIYNRWVQIILTFVLPYGFINFYPSQFFLNVDNSKLFHPAFQFATPVVGLICFLLSYQVWRIGLTKYQSTGS